MRPTARRQCGWILTAIRFDSVFGGQQTQAVARRGFGPDEFIRSELEKTIPQDVAASEKALRADFMRKHSAVGKAGCLSPEEYQAYFLDMSTRLHILDGATSLLKQVERPAPVARDLQAKLRNVGRAGGMSPEEFAAYLTDVRNKAIGPGPLAGGFNRVRWTPSP